MIGLSIPTYRPTQELVKLIDNIYQNNYFNFLIRSNKIKILIIDDGNYELQHTSILKQIAKKKSLKIIKNKSNMGQGYSIKKSIKYANDNNFDSVICVDDDGQHHIDDIVKVIEYANTNKSFFVIGVRKFTKNIPKRSFFGNKLTLIIISILFNYKFQDATSGLRFYHRETFANLLKIKNNKFDFQLIALISLRDFYDYVHIKTIYLKGNAHSRFKPYKDSVNIIIEIIKYRIKTLILSS